MPLIHQVCPECGYDWHCSTMMTCGLCLIERNAVVKGVRVKPRPAVTEATRAQIADPAAEASKYVT